MTLRLSTLAALALLVGLVAALTQLGSAVVARVAIDTLIRLVTVIGLSVFVGNSGILSFGHASFAAIGGYAAAWFTIPMTAKKIFLPQLPAFVLASQTGLPLGALVGIAAASLAALLIGIVVVRLSGVAASIATLAWLSIVYTVFANADAYTKGASSLVGLPLSVGPGIALGSALFALTVAFLFRRSRAGLMLNASREDEAAALACGMPVHRLRLLAFVLSGGLVALGGVLQGHFLGVLSINQFYLESTFLSLAMLVVGGIHSLSGAVVGTLLVSFAAEVLRVGSGGFELGKLSVPALPGLGELALALLMLIILIRRPGGIMGSAELRLPVTLGRRTRRPAIAEVAKPEDAGPVG